ncbi:Tyrosine--tRNA ligase, cytoplasmic [Astathelohania contejeani]|uniref:Tyrosine--tRNA ligase n=1 Tax=Astathelohania contejeani TaxID=164912 RepID=A0ABQ7I2N6_9MICR|nr:Tyrosine--tRNA ligase, cytoplasmic [Thelohania contejeani]
MVDKFNLITRNLQEIIGESELKEILSTRPLSIYWGTAPTGRPHIAYFVPILKIADFLKAGCKVKILLADIHAMLDNLKSSFDLVKYRTEYYETVIKAMLDSIGVDSKNIEFVRGSTYQTSPEYTMDLYKISTFTTLRDSLRAGSQVVKQIDNPLLSSQIYPSMQALDEEYLKVDAQFGGVDQRKIFIYAMKFLPKIGYQKRIHLMNSMIPGLNSDKMSASDELSKIDLVDTLAQIKKKINKSFCAEGDVNSGILKLLKYVVYPVFEAKGQSIEVSGRIYKTYEELEKDFSDKKIHPGDLKPAVGLMVDKIIAPIREIINDELLKKAYPDNKK